MPAEQNPIGTFPESEAKENPVLKQRSLEDLEDLVLFPAKMAEALAPPPPPAEEIESEPEPAKPESTEPEAPTEEIPDEPPGEEVPQEQRADAGETPDVEEEKDLEWKILQAKQEALEAANKKLESKLAGREAGQQGYIRQLKAQIKKLEESAQGEPDTEPDYRTEPEPRIKSVPSNDPVTVWAIQRSAQEAAAAFAQSHSDFEQMAPEVTKYLQETGYDASGVIGANDPIEASREVTRVLNEAYWHVRGIQKQQQVSEWEKKRADQVRGLEEAKKKATISASGSPPPPVAPRKTTKDMTVEELEAEMRKLGRR